MISVKMELTNEVYEKLLCGTARIRGSIGLVGNKRCDFRAHTNGRGKPGKTILMLPHGRTSISKEHVRMSIVLNRVEKLNPALAILDESVMASEFVEEMIRSDFDL